MKVIVGLGNPGLEYCKTRHNIGFMVVDQLAHRLGITEWRNKFDALVAEYRGKETVLLVKPQTYMNASGISVAAVARFYKIAADDLVVIYDDLDMPVGKVRIRGKGSSGGHRGIQSMIECLGNNVFSRVKVGIDHPKDGRPVHAHVLTPFTETEQESIDQSIQWAADAAWSILTEGLSSAMNQYNSKKTR